MTVVEFIEKYSPKFKATRVDSRPGKHDWHKNARHYLVTLATHRDEYVFFYSQGSSIKEGPILTDVLECLQSDCQIGEMTYKEAVNEIGEVDKGTWMACRETRDSLIGVFGRNGFADLLSIEF